MSKVYGIPASLAESAIIDEERYESLYAQSVEDNEGFWAEQGKRIDWIKPFTQVKDVSFARDDLHVRW